MKFEVIVEGVRLISDDGSEWQGSGVDEGMARLVNLEFDLRGHHIASRQVFEGLGERMAVEIVALPDVDVGDVMGDQ